MNTVTPEHLVTVTQGATSTQIAILVILGIIAFGVVFAVVKWLIDVKLGHLPIDLSNIRDQLTTVHNNLAKIEGKLWSKDDVRREIRAAISDHIEKCPFRNSAK